MFEELNKRRQAVADNIAKSFENDIEKALGAGYDPEGGDGDNVEKARQVGDTHPNGKWVWTEYRPGKFDWRPIKKKKEEEAPSGEKQSSEKTDDGNTNKLSQSAAKASDKALERAAKDPKASEEVKAAASAEIEKRSSGGEEKKPEEKTKKDKEKTKEKFTLKDYSEDEIEEMSSEEFNEIFSKEANNFLKNLSDHEIDKIGYGVKSDGSKTDYVVTRMTVQGSDENMKFELSRENGKYGWALIVSRGATEETDEDGYSYWSGDGGKKIFVDSDIEYVTAKEAVADLQKKIKTMSDGGEELKWENW